MARLQDALRGRVEASRVLCAAGAVIVLCGILAVALWPFHAPRNRVSWMQSENGLLFEHFGTVLGAGNFETGGPDEPSCSIELWVTPAFPKESKTLLAFHTPGHSPRFALHQSLSDLHLAHRAAAGQGGKGARDLYVDELFRSRRPRFITVASGPSGTTVYLDGVQVKFSRGFRIGGEDCGGRLVVGTSPGESRPWAGRLQGLAIYRAELTADQAARHYRAWTGAGRPELSEDERCSALYLFDERAGSVVHNRCGPGPNLSIPEYYTVLEQEFLTAFWEVPLDVPDMLRNVVAFVPLGFFLSGWLAGGPLVRRPALTAAAVGGLVSLTIEVLQFWLPTRQSDTMDIVTNTLGAWAGAMAYRHLVTRRLPRRVAG